MKKACGIVAVVLILCCMFSACGKSEALVGTWTVSEDGIEMSFIFNSDGTGKITALGGIMTIEYAYKVDGNKITFQEINQEVLGSEPYTYEIKGDKLSLTAGGEVMTLTKEK